MEEKNHNEHKYVTYKWLMVQTVSIAAVIMTAIIFFTSTLQGSLDTKVGREVFDERTKSLERLITSVEKISKENRDISIETKIMLEKLLARSERETK